MKKKSLLVFVLILFAVSLIAAQVLILMGIEIHDRIDIGSIYQLKPDCNTEYLAVLLKA
ncbi:hypothetical protein [Winogradskyella sediminis]|uniref:hypothetical protein n=1 Tax=Winogradskyella sediminis TaxID=1382466 RepID=UPI001472B216|nr:hypothetical protein [Winogradskyella sediminis]